MIDGDGEQFQIVAEKPIPETYSDSVGFEMSLFSITLEFGKSQKPRSGTTGKPPHIARVRVHMSPQHAKVMTKMLVKNMQGYEDQLGKIHIPKELLDQLGLEEEW